MAGLATYRCALSRDGVNSLLSMPLSAPPPRESKAATEASQRRRRVLPVALGPGVLGQQVPQARKLGQPVLHLIRWNIIHSSRAPAASPRELLPAKSRERSIPGASGHSESNFPESVGGCWFPAFPQLLAMHSEQPRGADPARQADWRRHQAGHRSLLLGRARSALKLRATSREQLAVAELRWPLWQPRSLFQAVHSS